MSDPRKPFSGIPPVLYHHPRRDFRLKARAFAAAMLFGAAFWAGAIYAAFGATVTQDGATLCSYSVATRYTAPAEAPMPKERGKP